MFKDLRFRGCRWHMAYAFSSPCCFSSSSMIYVPLRIFVVCSEWSMFLHQTSESGPVQSSSRWTCRPVITDTITPQTHTALIHQKPGMVFIMHVSEVRDIIRGDASLLPPAVLQQHNTLLKLFFLSRYHTL